MSDEKGKSELVTRAEPIQSLSLVQAAIQRGVDTDQLRELIQLQREHEAHEARKAYTRAMTAARAMMRVVRHDKEVAHPGARYTHASLAAVVAEAVRCLSPHGLSHAWAIEQDDKGMIRVVCTVTHADGHSESVGMSAPADDSGKKNRIQQVASTITYLERYTLIAACGMASSDQDDDGQGADDEPDPILADWYARIDECSDLDQLSKCGQEISNAGLSGRNLQAVRGAWASRKRELS